MKCHENYNFCDLACLQSYFWEPDFATDSDLLH